LKFQRTKRKRVLWHLTKSVSLLWSVLKNDDVQRSAHLISVWLRLSASQLLILLSVDYYNLYIYRFYYQIKTINYKVSTKLNSRKYWSQYQIYYKLPFEVLFSLGIISIHYWSTRARQDPSSVKYVVCVEKKKEAQKLSAPKKLVSFSVFNTRQPFLDTGCSGILNDK
jgi:hypothetical protein